MVTINVDLNIKLFLILLVKGFAMSASNDIECDMTLIYFVCKMTPCV